MKVEKKVDEINETLTNILDDYDFIEEEQDADIEYIDSITLERALTDRKEIE